jgi:hypothetical protein
MRTSSARSRRSTTDSSNNDRWRVDDRRPTDESISLRIALSKHSNNATPVRRRQRGPRSGRSAMPARCSRRRIPRANSRSDSRCRIATRHRAKSRSKLEESRILRRERALRPASRTSEARRSTRARVLRRRVRRPPDALIRNKTSDRLFQFLESARPVDPKGSLGGPCRFEGSLLGVRLEDIGQPSAQHPDVQVGQVVCRHEIGALEIHHQMIIHR